MGRLQELGRKAKEMKQRAGQTVAAQFDQATAGVREAVTQVRTTVTEVRDAVQQGPQRIDTMVRAQEAKLPRVTDPAVLDAVKAVQGVLKDDFIDVTPYNMYLRVEDMVNAAGKHAQHTLSALPHQFTLNDFARLIMAAAQGQNEIEATNQNFWGGRTQRKTLAEVGRSKVEDAMIDAEANGFLGSTAEIIARAVMVWGSETPMDLFRDATGEKGAEGVKAIEPVIKAALFDEVMQVMGKDHKATRIQKEVTQPRGMLKVMEKASQHGLSGALVQGAENKLVEYAHNQITARAAKAGLAEQPKAIHDGLREILTSAAEEVSKVALGAIEGIELHGKTAADTLFRKQAEKTVRLYDEALREGVVAYVHTIMSDPQDPRHAEVKRMVQETAVDIHKEESTLGRTLGNTLRRMTSHEQHTVVTDLEAAYARDAKARTRKEAVLQREAREAQDALESAQEALANMPEVTGSRRSPEAKERANQQEQIEELTQEMLSAQRAYDAHVQAGESDQKLVEVFDLAIRGTDLKQVEKNMKAARRGK